MKKITIISLGWFGLPLYNKLAELHAEVSGSYFSTPKKVLNEYQFDINGHEVNQYISDAEIVVVALPPSRVIHDDNFINFLISLSDKKIIFISSTSVYGNQGEVDELTPPIPESKNGIRLLKWENILQENFKNYQIIRSAGQYGAQRHPGKFLSGKVDVRGAKDKINLISQEDLVDITVKAIDSSKSSIINAVNINHPIKEKYYMQYCRAHNLPLPTFSNETHISTKVVSSIHSEYQVTNPLS